MARRYAGTKIKGTVGYTHVVVAERALGRGLPLGAQVHHVDENKRNNAHANLVICQDQAYHSLLHVRTRIVKAGGNPNTQAICSRCRCLKARSEFSAKTAASNGITNYCRSCVSASRK